MFTKILGWAAEEVVGKRTLDWSIPRTRNWRSPTGWTCWPMSGRAAGCDSAISIATDRGCGWR